ncbi:MAG: Asparagine synthetase [Gemmatimonadetes bacterium]|nr:Asparagine synthetase [Gemmatimonadota bacterium]
MCGLGAVVLCPGSSVSAGDVVRRMADRMLSRGPDAGGCWLSPDGTAALGHRRLAILDLDDRSSQPMTSTDGRYVIAYNGEIYNYREIRSELIRDGVTFRTEGDTEVLLALYQRLGVEMLPKLRGMFAFAIWDTVTKSMLVARDPYGIKPLYVGRFSRGWVVASQVKAILAARLVSAEPDPYGQAGFWLTGSVPEPRTWFRDIESVPAGSWRRLHANESGPATSFWDVRSSWLTAPDCQLSEAEVQDSVRSALLSSVRSHLVADVPVGVFLSGGIDSGSLAALMRDVGCQHITAATIAFSEFHGTPDDEAPEARKLAQRYGLDHHIRTVTREEFEKDIPRILDSIDQPSRDGVNTWYAAKVTAELGLKVVISGVGGDELFYGYPTFTRLASLVANWRRLGRVPGLQELASGMFRVRARVSRNARWAMLPQCAESLYGAYYLQRGFFAPSELPALMGQELSHIALGGVNPIDLVRIAAEPIPADSAAAVGRMESTLYLRNQLLRDSDWASMAHSVELRTPLVDAWLLRDLEPVLRTFGRFKGKSLLARSPSTPLTDELIRRRKSGFGSPIGKWLAGSAIVRDLGVPNPTRSSVWMAQWAQVLGVMTYRSA